MHRPGPDSLDTRDYRRLDAADVPAYLATVPALAARLGGGRADWRVREVSDGYMNLVFLVDGPAGSLCLKQALPHVRQDASRPLPLDRAAYEVAWLRLSAPHAPGRVTELYHYDPAQFAIAMEALRPHVVLRQGLMRGLYFPEAARHVAEYVADVTFHTSDLALPFTRKFANMAVFASNEVILRITVDLILTDPYVDSPRNRWTRPFLDDAARAIRDDAALKQAVAGLGYRFLTHTQALLHGDLHTGSVMATPTDTRVIDGEFALYGPIGFDLGAFVANLLLAWFSQPGHAAEPGARAAFQDWLLDQVPLFWSTFRARFLGHWRSGGGGDGYPAAFFADGAGAAALEAARQRFVAGIWQDLLGYAGMKMVRRILSYAHVPDFEAIADPARRARLEVAALSFARWLILHRATLADPAALVGAARGWVPDLPLAASVAA